MSDLAVVHDIPAVTPEAPFSRPPELLVPTVLTPRAEAFCVAVDAFMDDDQHRLIELGLRHGLRLDRYPEDGDMVYSVIHAIHPLDGTRPDNTLQATSIVAGEDGRAYGERHWFKPRFAAEGLGGLAVPHAGIRHPLRRLEWREQIIPVTRALQDDRRLLKVVS